MKYRTNSKIIRDLFRDCDDNARQDVITTMREAMLGLTHVLDDEIHSIMYRRLASLDVARDTISKLLHHARKLTKYDEREAFEYCEQYVEIYKD